ncbi:hypothetical protein [Herbidospora sp. RD11066]
MSIDLGDVVPLSVVIRDAAGQLADASQVHLTITLPDGTAAAVGPVAPTSTGVYDHDYATVQAGHHVVRWVATGANASAYTDAFDVQPADGSPWISLADLKNHLKQSGIATSDDEKLRGNIASACRVITDRMGEVSPITAVLEVERRGKTIILPVRPVIAITSVEQLPGLAVIPQADRAAGISGWSLESVEGVLVHTGGRFGSARVTWRAGRNPIPPNFRLAALELAGHLWRTSQLNGGGGRPPVSNDEVIVPGVSFALPYSVRQLLGLDKRPQDEILVG